MTLDPKYRSVIYLHYYEGYRTGKAYGTVRIGSQNAGKKSQRNTQSGT